MKNLIKTLKILESRKDSSRFVSGDCHHLAMALQSEFGGELCAIIRNEFDSETGVKIDQVYSHMILVINEECYDIDGKDADARWEDLWENNDYSFHEFEYLHLQKDAVKDFVINNNGHYSDNIVEELDVYIKAIVKNLCINKTNSFEP